MSTISADPILKDHLKKKEIFADIVNNILYDGKQVLDPDSLENYDTDMSTLFNTTHPFSINRNRDIITKANINGIYMLIAIENQSTIDPLMPLRVLMYDALSYHQQYRQFQSLKRFNSKLSFELLPVHTIVIYYGEGDWTGPKSLLEMMNIPENIKKFLNNWIIHIVDVKNLSYHKFRDKENYDFFKYLQRLYKWNGNLESLKDMVVSKDVATLLAAVAGNTKILEIVKHSKGDEVDMCRSIDLFEARAIKNGEKNGTLNTLLKLLQSKFGTLSQDTRNNIENSSMDQLDKLTLSIFDLNSEDDINLILNN